MDETIPETISSRQANYHKCHVHDEIVKVFCQDCKMAVCHVCCSINHRSCQKVVSLRDAIIDLTTSIVKRKGENLEYVTNTKTVISKRKKYIQQVSENVNNVREDVKRAIADAIKLLKAKENTLLKELNDFESIETQKLSEENFVDDVIIRQVEEEIDAIDLAVGNTDVRGICQMYEKFESRPVRETVAEAKRPDRIGFRWSPDDAEAAVAGSTFGAMYTVEAGDVGRETTPILQKEINVSSPQDETDPAVVVVMVTGGRKLIVVTDVKNRCIKCFNTDGVIECVGEQKIGEGPFGLTSIGQNEVVVTFPQNDVLARFSVNPVNFLETVARGRSYQGLARTGDGSIIACCYPFLRKSSIDIIDPTGRILRKLDIGFNRHLIFVCAALDGGILTSDNSTKSLLYISPGGKVSTLYKPKEKRSLVNPRAIAVTKTGDILLADSGVHKVIHLTAQGEFIRDLLTLEDGIRRPHSIVLDEEGFLYVTCDTCVKVFRFE